MGGHGYALSMTPLLLALPWLALLLFVRFCTRIPSELPSADRLHGSEVPSVTVVVPARNEALNIERCVRSLVASRYPDFEVVVVDDRSDDGTARLARGVPAGNATRLHVVDGAPLPEGWLGKPWACWQGAREATGELLLFTDADTVHGPDLLARAVVGLAEEGADLLTVVGAQEMDSFWERLVQPQIFLMMLLRFPDFERIAKNGRWRDAIANGQYLLFPRRAYEAIGGHESVRGEVVEDLRLAQLVKSAGLRLRIRGAESDLATRMYRSLSHLLEGWSKNIVRGGLQSLPPVLRPVAPALSFLGGVVLWLAAPGVLLVAAGAAMTSASPAVPAPVLSWAVAVYAVSCVLWSYFSHRMGTSAWYGPLYPLGAAVGAYIFLRSWVRGRNVEWKGRRYSLPAVSDRS